MERRIVRLVVPGRSPNTVVVDASGELPSFELTLEPRTTTVSSVVRTVLPSVGLTGHVLDCYINQTQLPDGDQPVPVLVELPVPPLEWVPPAGWRAIRVGVHDHAIEAPLQERLDAWIAAQAVGTADTADTGGTADADDPPQPPWTRPGWFERVQGWVASSLRAAELPQPDQLVQDRHWGISTIVQVETGVGRYWFKAVCDHFRREAGITAFLDRLAPGTVAPVIAADGEEGWLLLGDLGTSSRDPDPGDVRQPYAALRALQRRVAGAEDSLVASGCAERPMRDLPAEFARCMRDPRVAAWIDLPPATIERCVIWLEDAVQRVDRLGLPDVLVHGDFHAGNVADVGDGRRIVFDWSDAAIAQPFVDVVTWASWIPDDAAGRDAVWAAFIDGWSDTLPPSTWQAMRPTLEGVAGAYHMISYAGIITSLAPLRQAEHAIGLSEFYAFLEPAIAADG